MTIGNMALRMYINELLRCKETTKTEVVILCDNAKPFLEHGNHMSQSRLRKCTSLCTNYPLSSSHNQFSSRSNDSISRWASSSNDNIARWDRRPLAPSRRGHYHFKPPSGGINETMKIGRSRRGIVNSSFQAFIVEDLNPARNQWTDEAKYSDNTDEEEHVGGAFLGLDLDSDGLDDCGARVEHRRTSFLPTFA